ncbi:uncharacterized protein LOC116404776 [Cucumis sativus]|uniref:uncharacterized protein LOC116404776 n=1 Tax=Cucumis sativus TaxID=3659 RepID=UPI0012F4D1CE|nr:uncharacterized protein LOC116404776 [Cucumis sativus]
MRILSRCSENTIIQCSPSMLSLIVLHHELDLNVSFQMTPRFFNHFASNKTHSSKTLTQPLFNTLKRMKESKFTSLSFFVLQPLDHLVLKLYPPRSEPPLIRKFGKVYAVKENLGNVDLETFVSIDSLQFRRIINKCRDYFVSVTPRHSDVKFSNEVREFIFPKEGAGDQCIVEGETEFLIPTYPFHVYNNISFEAKRVWFFKSVDKLGSFIIAPVGLFARFSIYFPIP